MLSRRRYIDVLVSVWPPWSPNQRFWCWPWWPAAQAWPTTKSLVLLAMEKILTRRRSITTTDRRRVDASMCHWRSGGFHSTRAPSSAPMVDFGFWLPPLQTIPAQILHPDHNQSARSNQYGALVMELCATLCTGGLLEQFLLFWAAMAGHCACTHLAKLRL